MLTSANLKTPAVLALAAMLLVVCCRDFTGSDANVHAGGVGGNTGGQDPGGGSGESSVASGSGSLPIGGTPPSSDAGGAAGDGNAPGSAGAGGETAQAGSDFGPRSPATLPGLALWLEAATGSFTTTDSRVSKWKDGSGLGNHALQTDVSRRPLLRAQDVNGYPSVLFDGKPSNLVVRDDASLQLGDMFTVAFVAEWTNDAKPEYTGTVGVDARITYAGYGAIMTKTESSPPFAGLGIFANFPSPFETEPTQRRLGVQLELSSAQLVSSSLNLNDGDFRLFIVQRPHAGSLDFRINGRAQGHVDIPPEVATDALGKDLLFGGETWRDFRGALAEFVIVNGPLDDADLVGIEAHLMTKFGL